MYWSGLIFVIKCWKWLLITSRHMVIEFSEEVRTITLKAFCFLFVHSIQWRAYTKVHKWVPILGAFEHVYGEVQYPSSQASVLHFVRLSDSVYRKRVKPVWFTCEIVESWCPQAVMLTMRSPVIPIFYVHLIFSHKVLRIGSIIMIRMICDS